MTDATQTLFKFVPAEAHTQDGRAVAVMLIEDPLNYMRPATTVEQALNTENERLLRALSPCARRCASTARTSPSRSN